MNIAMVILFWVWNESRLMQTQTFLSQLKAWAEEMPDILGVLLVGSQARGTARADSDIDLIVLTTEPSRYLDSVSFADNFGSVLKCEKEDWGHVTSVRVRYREGMEVEYGVALPDWAAEPLDAGTRRVISDGVRIIFDREGQLARLVENMAKDSKHLP